jgi:DNA-binding NarL/FixJ family response regulator
MPTEPQQSVARPEGASGPVRLALSNDYEVVLRGLAAMLAEHQDRVQVVELTLEPRITAEVDVILYDTFGRLPDGDAKLRQVVRENRARVLVYSWDAYPEDAARAAGAAGYLHKGVPAEQLVDAVVSAHEGRPVTATGTGPDDGEMPQWPGQEHGLSAREAEMLTFLARGYTNKEIGDRSYLSINTVKTYLRTGYAKIGANSRSQAVAWAIRNGLGGS